VGPQVVRLLARLCRVFGRQEARKAPFSPPARQQRLQRARGRRDEDVERARRAGRVARAQLGHQPAQPFRERHARVDARVGADLDLSFALDIGLGFSMSRGLFVEALDAADTAEVVLEAALSLTGGTGFAIDLGPITFAATDARTDPELTATLPLDIGTGTRFYATDLPALVTNATVLASGGTGVEANLAFDLSADVFGPKAKAEDEHGVGFGATLAVGYANGGVAGGGPV
jgi:hypothetical protein